MAKASIFYIIDDDRDDQDYLIAALKEIDPNTEYFTAFNGQEGFRKLELGLIPIPSVIFLDLNMPRVNGRQFLMAMKKNPQFQDILTVVYSTSATQKDIEETKQLGASFYLEKQPDYSILKEELQKILLLIPEV
jgi:CheY-like chemotaxis protein